MNGIAVAIMGATACGKSTIAMRVAAACDNTLIISCDSMQVYRGLDIGTAKPSKNDQKKVRHSMLDCVSLPESYSAARWANEAVQHIISENKAGRVPLIVGGTGLYLRALLQPLAAIPDIPNDIRKHWQTHLESIGSIAMHAHLQQLDIAMADQLRPCDSQRIIRALSVLTATGKSLLWWQQQPATVDYNIQCPIFIPQLERATLHTRIEQRFMQMEQQGWLDEVCWLKDQGLANTHPAMRAVGYRQWLSFLQGECSQNEARQAGIIATRRYAKRQITWFRHQTPQAQWHNDAELLKMIIISISCLQLGY
ncbi:MAG: tRNA (adenosine(37)-N6)-dimethylallyltransferase MiaA [Mariprofundales bacterium]